VVIAVALAALAAPALAHAAPQIARPNPVVYPLRLDYESPLPGSTAPLEQTVIMAATRDQAFLAYERLDDLGGFMPAQVGRQPLTSGGRDVLSPGTHTPQIPLFQQAAGGKVSSFTFTGTPPTGPTPPPDNGNRRGIAPPPPPTPGTSVPPANQGFGGRPSSGQTGPGSTTTTTTGGSGGGVGSGTTTPTKSPPPPPTTTTGATTTTTTTATTTTAGGGGGGGGGGSGGCGGGGCAAGSCGTAGIQIDSTPPGCVITLTNAAPGDSVSELMTITNTSDTTYTLGFRAVGASNNHLWQDLQLDVFDPALGPAAPMPPLQAWLGSFHTLTTLNPGQTVQYEIELYLPTTAGNADQGKAATITFDWQAVG
jgi:spore coat-associated protein N